MGRDTGHWDPKIRPIDNPPWQMVFLLRATSRLPGHWAVSGDVPLYGIYGAGGCGRGVIPVADELLARRSDSYQLVFIVDDPRVREINGRRVVSLDEFAEIPASSRNVSIAVADPGDRRRLDARCREKSLGFFSVVALSTVLMDDVNLGEGAILSPFVTLTSNIRVGRHFHANLYSYVEHDCRIGDFVTFAPSVRCNGNIIIEDGAYLGSGCMIRQGNNDDPLVIGEGAVVGMGAVVTKSVPAGTTVVGNPARPLDAR